MAPGPASRGHPYAMEDRWGSFASLLHGDGSDMAVDVTVFDDEEPEYDGDEFACDPENVPPEKQEQGLICIAEEGLPWFYQGHMTEDDISPSGWSFDFTGHLLLEDGKSRQFDDGGQFWGYTSARETIEDNYEGIPKEYCTETDRGLIAPDYTVVEIPYKLVSDIQDADEYNWLHPSKQTEKHGSEWLKASRAAAIKAMAYLPPDVLARNRDAIEFLKKYGETWSSGTWAPELELALDQPPLYAPKKEDKGGPTPITTPLTKPLSLLELEEQAHEVLEVQRQQDREDGSSDRRGTDWAR